jgi:hypothetical protein
MACALPCHDPGEDAYACACDDSHADCLRLADPDPVVHDRGPEGKSASGWGHPKCAGTEADVANEVGAGVGGASMK